MVKKPGWKQKQKRQEKRSRPHEKSPSADARPSETKRSSSRAEWWGIGGVVVALISGSIPWLLPDDTPLFVKVCLTVATLGIAVACVTDRKKVRFASIAGAAASLALWGVLSLATMPTDADRRAEAFFRETESAEIWVGRDPRMFDGSRVYISQHLDELFNADDRWKSPPIDAASSSFGLIQDGVAFEGKSVLSIGQVIVAQSWDNGELIVQLSPLTEAHASAPAVGSAVSERWQYKADIDRMLGDTRTDLSETATHVIYCRTPADPFTSLSPGDVVLVKGVLVAYGRTMNTEGKFVDVAYMMCNTWERVIDEGSSYDDRPTGTTP